MRATKNHLQARILWSSALLITGFLCANHLAVLTVFLFHGNISPFIWPASLFLCMLTHVFVSRRIGTSPAERWWPVLISLLVIACSLLFAAFYFDFSWDGQWYHQAAIYSLEKGWNPIAKPITTFDDNNDLSILHFPKGSWYYATTVLSTFGSMEAGKSINMIALFATLFVVYAALVEFGFSSLKSFLLALLVGLNPVVWSEITTYLVDGLLFLYLTMYAFAMLKWIRQRTPANAAIIILAAICVMNIKFTGVVFFCVFAVTALAYLLLWKRKYLSRFIAIQLAAACLALLVFGYNPYITNTVERGHPLYPIMGSKTYPSIFEQTGKDDNELYETPKNIIGKNVMAAFLYTSFSRPGNAPYNKVDNADLIWPFASTASDWKAYHFQETRVSGFGPFFSGILIFTFLLLLWVLIYDKEFRWIAMLSVAAIFSCLLFSKLFWWPRLVTQVWLVPLIPLMLILYKNNNRKLLFCTGALAGLMGLNGLLVLVIHMNWETRSSLKLQQQLTHLQMNHTPIEIDYGWFKRSMEEKLGKWGIKYQSVPRKLLKKMPHDTLMSVVEGYPNVVLFREMNRQAKDTGEPKYLLP